MNGRGYSNIISSSLAISVKNVLLYSCFFVAVVAIIVLIYGDTPPAILEYLLESHITLPNTFFSVLFCATGYIFSVLFISVLASEKSTGFFSTALLIRIAVFLLNIIPIAVFRDGLSPILGFCLIYFPLFYFLFHYLIESQRSRILVKLGTNNCINVISMFLIEIIPLMAAGFLVYIIMPSEFRQIEWRNIDIDAKFEHFTYLVYIIFFNCITFFSVEFGISCVNGEHKKNHAKYYFRYHEKMLSRFLYLLKSASPQILGKLKKNISWLVFFIITTETIFEPSRSIGLNLLDGYATDSIIIIQNAFYLFIIMCIINTGIDLISLRFGKGYSNNETSNINDETKLLRFSPQKPGRIKIILFAAIAIVYIFLFVFAYKEYPIAGYYDFETNIEKTVGDIKDRYVLETQNITQSELEQKLCEKSEDGYGYYITSLSIIAPDGRQMEIIPFFEKTDNRFYYIEGVVNTQKKSLNGAIVSVSRSLKYTLLSRIPLLGKTEISFRLPADTKKNSFSMKPFYLIFPYFILYFLTMVIIVYVITSLFYHYNIREHLRRISGIERPLQGRVVEKIHSIILQFMNSFTLLLVFFLVNLFLQRHFAETNWENRNFALNIAYFTLVQVLIIWMFSDSFVPEFKLHIQIIFNSNEFKYFRLIGIDHNGQYINYKTKYGNRLFLKIFIQNILFITNINYFISYAFNIWSHFKDNIGMTYSISFENIFTKIVHLERQRTFWYYYAILIIFYGSLFAAYYYLQKRQEKDG
jgi:hypothetical protein